MTNNNNNNLSTRMERVTTMINTFLFNSLYCLFQSQPTTPSLLFFPTKLFSQTTTRWENGLVNQYAASSYSITHGAKTTNQSSAAAATNQENGGYFGSDELTNQNYYNNTPPNHNFVDMLTHDNATSRGIYLKHTQQLMSFLLHLITTLIPIHNQQWVDKDKSLIFFGADAEHNLPQQQQSDNWQNNGRQRAGYQDLNDKFTRNRGGVGNMNLFDDENDNNSRRGGKKFVSPVTTFSSETRGTTLASYRRNNNNNNNNLPQPSIKPNVTLGALPLSVFIHNNAFNLDMQQQNELRQRSRELQEFKDDLILHNSNNNNNNNHNNVQETGVDSYDEDNGGNDGDDGDYNTRGGKKSTKGSNKTIGKESNSNSTKNKNDDANQDHNTNSSQLIEYNMSSSLYNWKAQFSTKPPSDSGEDNKKNRPPQQNAILHSVTQSTVGATSTTVITTQDITPHLAEIERLLYVLLQHKLCLKTLTTRLYDDLFYKSYVRYEDYCESSAAAATTSTHLSATASPQKNKKYANKSRQSSSMFSSPTTNKKGKKNAMGGQLHLSNKQISFLRRQLLSAKSNNHQLVKLHPRPDTLFWVQLTTHPEK